MDRTPRNTNLLLWHRRLWLIDHGASLYAHHTPGWAADPAKAKAPFPLITNHVLTRRATRLREIDGEMAARLTPEVIAGVADSIPLVWLQPADPESPAAHREDYARYLMARLAAPRAFVEEAIGVR